MERRKFKLTHYPRVLPSLMLSLRAHGRVHHSISDRESIAGSTAGEEPYVILSVTVLGEAYQRRLLLSTSVWMELYAGTRRRADKQDLNRMVQALTSVGHVASPEPERGGQPTPSWCRCAQ